MKKLGKIKSRYWIITIYLLIVFLGFLLVKTFTENYIQTNFENSDGISILFVSVWTIFSNFGIYFIICLVIPLIGFIISKRLKRLESKIAFKFLTMTMLAFFILYISYWMTLR